MSLIYLASPYTHKNEAVREYRFLVARYFTITSLRNHQPIFSPIVYGKDMERQIGTDYLSWQAINDAMIRACSEFWVLQIDGWEDSKGVRHEIKLAKALRKPITYLEPPELPR